LNDVEWKEFFVGNIFNVRRSIARSEKQYQDGKIPFIASGNVNNGVIRFCEPLEKDKELDKGNCITVSPVDGSSFYQNINFLGRGGAGSSILLLYNEQINRYSGIFFSQIIRRTCSKYCYGKMGNQESIKREKILLPVTNIGSINYKYMEDFIKIRMLKKYKEYLSCVK